MYTGKTPKQSVDHFRLEEGVRFLHANLLSTSANEPSQVLTSETMQSSNLYGIQISSAQKTNKETLNRRNIPSTGARSAPQGEQTQLQLSLAIGLEGVGPEQQSSHFPAQVGTAVKSIEDIQNTVKTIKQEAFDTESLKSPQHSSLSQEEVESSFVKADSKTYSCHYCGEHFDSRSTLRDHLHIHVSQSLPFGVPTSILESDDLGEVRPILENIQNIESCHPYEALQNATQSEQLQLNQLSFLSKDAEPIELNCNFSFLRKRKFTCTVCGHRFARRSLLLEHLYTHKTKSHKLSRYQRSSNQADLSLHNYCNNLTDNNQKDDDTALEPPFLEDLEDTNSQENEDSVLVE